VSSDGAQPVNNIRGSGFDYFLTDLRRALADMLPEPAHPPAEFSAALNRLPSRDVFAKALAATACRLSRFCVGMSDTVTTQLAPVSATVFWYDRLCVGLSALARLLLRPGRKRLNKAKRKQQREDHERELVHVPPSIDEKYAEEMLSFQHLTPPNS
jgi:hypothetical protein